jgi:MoCo/4Fe-4S cofactor protein with predicted Tat translocation signal
MAPEKPTRYWKSWEEGPGSSELVQISAGEFPEPLDGPGEQFSRRSFLKAAGFSAAVATIATGCSRAPVEKAIPYLIQPEEIVPGVSYFYASTCAGCAAGCGVLVKNRDGRPVKLEGNADHPLSRGGLCAIGQASLLDLYDSQRLKEPRIEGRASAWEEVDHQITDRLAAIRASGGAVRFVSSTITSPSLKAGVQRFLAQFRDSKHVTYDALSSSAILDAHERTHGARLLPHYLFDRAEVIASFDADFLGTWISPVEFTEAYSAGRRLDALPLRMSHHVQFESRMSLTGSKADRRIRIAPRELSDAMAHLAAQLAKLSGTPFPGAITGSATDLGALLDDLARRLWEARGRSLVICGSQEVNLQLLANFMNHVLGNYGATLDLDRAAQQRAGDDRALQGLLEELRQGRVAAIFLYGINPVFELPNGSEFTTFLQKTPLVVSLADRLDETSSLARFLCPDHHPLESWGDAEPVRGVISLFQPAIHPLGNTRAALESLAAWSGRPQPAYDAFRGFWKDKVFPRQDREKDFGEFWDRSVETGFAEVTPERVHTDAFRASAIASVPMPDPEKPGEFDVVLYSKPGILEGRHAGNPWLQELPDPVSKVAWDNYAALSPATASRLGFSEGDVVRLETSTANETPVALELPVYIQPGQHDRVIAVALGYGGISTQRFASVGPKWLFGGAEVGDDGRVGKNAAPWFRFVGGNLQFIRHAIKVNKTGNRHPLASTQVHHTLTIPENVPLVGGKHREIVRETTLAALLAGSQAASPAKPVQGSTNGLWPPDHAYTGHRWAMAIDLTACTGCSGCVIACQAENNIPVVGKDEVLRHREMHWIRIDRYYSGEDDVDVVHQPMMCQQCDNAPCETVCPVLATVHSAEGLNQQIYNRCVGTRYCANNCPYKVRRFNWFNYVHDDHLQNLTLNPDVTVRSRGIMEKCSFCIQRIESARIESKRRGTNIVDGQIQTACQQSCPARAIVFGDLNDPNSRVAQLARDRRRFGVLEEFNFRPSINYLSIVRNRDEAEEGHTEKKDNG